MCIFRLKEKFPHWFQDLCLYCEVADILGLYKFKIHIRRFIQGLFANVNFDPVSCILEVFFLFLFKDVATLCSFSDVATPLRDELLETSPSVTYPVTAETTAQSRARF